MEAREDTRERERGEDWKWKECEINSSKKGETDQFLIIKMKEKEELIPTWDAIRFGAFSELSIFSERI